MGVIDSGEFNNFFFLEYKYAKIVHKKNVLVYLNLNIKIPADVL